MEVFVKTNFMNWVRHPAAEKANPTDESAIHRLRTSMKRFGYLEEFPIVVTENDDSNYEVVDGWHRLRACRDLGIEPTHVCVDGTVEELFDRAEASNVMRRHTNPYKLAARFISRHPEFKTVKDRTNALVEIRLLGPKKATEFEAVWRQANSRDREEFLYTSLTMAGLSKRLKDRDKRSKGTAPLQINFALSGVDAALFQQKCESLNILPREKFREICKAWINDE
ncbi:MAG: hypothetical protein F4039_03085 [Gammaproteobacteria bacterium]|nr:hypothetical protein [Gammaproteobacteria bacterium]MYF52762.1 hypothetical protein [Gammaproteobacteria bacterium]MYK43059.1 hypothetical protein [Gammaproteobacteria bacterium]